MRLLTPVICAALAACATTGDTPPPAPFIPESLCDQSAELDGGSRDLGGTLPVTRTTDGAAVKDFLPFLDVAMDPKAVDSDVGTVLVDRYTRIRIETLDPRSHDTAGVAAGDYASSRPDRSYQQESRSWLSRMLGSKTVSRTLLAEFELSRPDVRATEALFSASFSSDRETGESWSTDQSIALYATPWFKVSANSTMTTKIRMQLADERESASASAMVMGALSNATNLIAPTTPLLTYFNSPSLTDASNFLDASVSSLFGRAITEQSTGTLALRNWQDCPVVVVYAAMPDARDIRKTHNADQLGAWAVSLEEPIFSMFTRQTQTSADGWETLPDYAGVSSTDILSFEMDRNLSVRNFILTELGLGDRIAALNSDPSPDLARQVCQRIERGLSGQGGLNAFDAAAAIYAAASSELIDRSAKQILTHPETCQPMALYQKLSGEVFPPLVTGSEADPGAFASLND